MIAPYFPFFIDSSVQYRNKESAEAAAEKWRQKKITITVQS